MHNIQRVVESLLTSAEIEANTDAFDREGVGSKQDPAAGSREAESIRKRLDTLEDQIASLARAMERIERALKDR